MGQLGSTLIATMDMMKMRIIHVMVTIHDHRHNKLKLVGWYVWFFIMHSAMHSNLQAGKLAIANASENLAGRVGNRPGQVEFCIG